MRNSYVKFDDYVEPVRNYLNDDFGYQIVPGFHKKSMLFIRQGILQAEDSLSSIGGTTKESFYGIYKSADDFGVETSSGQLITITFTMDAAFENYQRTVYNILDMSGQLGGLYEVFEVMFGFFATALASKILTFTIMKRMYHEDLDHPNSDIDKIRNHKFRGNHKNSVYPIDSPSQNIISMNEESKTPSTPSDTDSLKSSKYESRNELQLSTIRIFGSQNELVQKLKETVSKKRKFEFKCSDIISSLMPLGSCSTKSKTKSKCDLV